MPTTDDKVILKSLPCPGCGGYLEVKVTVNQAVLMTKPRADRPHIQQVMPELSADDRERFISGYCSPCWDAIYDTEED